MKHRSSIFSFKTLQGSFRPGAAVWLALALLVAAELGLRILTPNLGWYEGMSSLNQWVSLLRHELKTRRPEIWLMGNSILAYSVDVERLNADHGLSVAALPIGGSTLGGDTAMLEYFLRRAPRSPRTVLFCITKDDLNPNGGRARTSRRYIEYDTWRGISPERLFRLVDSRQTLMNSAKGLLLGRSTASERHPSLPPFKGVVTPETAFYMDGHMRNYAFDESAFPEIQRLSRNYGFQAGLVLLPVSRVYLEYHDEHRPELTYSQITEKLKALCEQYGLAFHDFSHLAPDTAAFYTDPYHMTAEGRAFFTPRLADLLRSDASRSGGNRAAIFGVEAAAEN